MKMVYLGDGLKRQSNPAKMVLAAAAFLFMPMAAMAQRPDAPPPLPMEEPAVPVQTARGGSPIVEADASFDCKKALTPAEVAICSDATLAVLDRKLASVYRATRARHPLPEYVLARQRDWLESRDYCFHVRSIEVENGNACLQRSYRERLRGLELPKGSMVFSNAASFAKESNDVVIEIKPLAGAFRLDVWGGFIIHRLFSEEQGQPVYTGCEFKGDVFPSESGQRWTAFYSDGGSLVLRLRAGSIEIVEGVDGLCWGFGSMPDGPYIIRPLR